MKVRTYDVLARAVEEGLESGWRRAHKHTDTPGEDTLKEYVYQAILNEICNVFDFEEPPGEPSKS